MTFDTLQLLLAPGLNFLPEVQQGGLFLQPNDNLFELMIGLANAAIAGMNVLGDFATRLLYVSFIIGVFYLLYNAFAGGKDFSPLAIIPMFILTSFVYWIGVEYESDAGLKGFVGFSHDIVKYAVETGFSINPHTSNAFRQLAERQGANFNIDPNDPGAFILKNPLAIVSMSDLIVSKIPLSHSIFDFVVGIVSLLTVVVVIISFWAIAIVLFLNLLLFKFFSVVGMIMLPLMLAPPFKAIGQKSLENLIVFAVKFMTFGVVISLIIQMFTIFFDRLNAEATFGIFTLIYICVISVTFTLCMMTVPAKVAQMFGGGIAFGDGAVSSLYQRALGGAVAAAGFAAISAGMAAAKPAVKLGAEKLGDAILKANPTSMAGHVLKETAKNIGTTGERVIRGLENISSKKGGNKFAKSMASTALDTVKVVQNAKESRAMKMASLGAAAAATVTGGAAGAAAAAAGAAGAAAAAGAAGAAAAASGAAAATGTAADSSSASVMPGKEPTFSKPDSPASAPSSKQPEPPQPAKKDESPRAQNQRQRADTDDDVELTDLTT